MKKEKLSFLAGIGVTLVVAIGAVLAVTMALKSNTLSPVAPNVPQVKPRAEEPATTAACGLSFTVAAAPVLVCNSDCATSADCPNELACVNGRCRNTACTAQADCKCPPPPKVCNDTCTVKEECSSGMTCAGGRCRNLACITSESCVCPTPVVYPPAPVTPKPPAEVATHMACRNRACVTVSGAGADTCSSDVSCQPAVVSQPIPESGVELPTLLTIIGGVGLVIVGLLVL